VQVLYRLTEKGQALEPILKSIGTWAAEHKEPAASEAAQA
jgi:DNA-binding HxlR family transcriptional regulator